ncbi:MAG: hypothetical protein BJ554DRAFT_2264, partial [Olpidium bornovanus]
MRWAPGVAGAMPPKGEGHRCVLWWMLLHQVRTHGLTLLVVSTPRTNSPQSISRHQREYPGTRLLPVEDFLSQSLADPRRYWPGLAIMRLVSKIPGNLVCRIRISPARWPSSRAIAFAGPRELVAAAIGRTRSTASPHAVRRRLAASVAPTRAER